jgi:hypothetical protein
MTSIEYLIEQLQAPCRDIPSHIIEQAKEMYYKETMNAMQRGMELQESYSSRPSFRERNGLVEIPQQEISDEEIKKAANNPNNDGYSFLEGAKWYREKLKGK